MTHRPLLDFKKKHVLVQGLGRFSGGVGVTRWLVQQGARVTLTDIEPAEKLADSLAALADVREGITFKLGGHDVADFTACEVLVANPAVDKAANEYVQAARQAGIPITTEMNLFAERCRGFTIGITGSVGKSTTTTLIFEALKAGLERKSEFGNQNSELPRVYLGGNIGKSLLSELANIHPHDLVVLELSSFMLEDTPAIQWSPNVAVITNLFPNHLDRHHTMAEYAATKQNILAFQRPFDVAIFNNDHELISRWVHFARGRVVKYTTHGPGHLNLVMPGEHNQSNARAALAVLDNLLEPAKGELNHVRAQHAIEHFGGLAHRLQVVHVETQGAPPAPPTRTIRYYNDSKATTPDASITALNAFAPGTAIFLVGGYDKHIDLSPFEKLLAERAGGVIGLGQTGEAILANVRAANPTLARERIAYAGTLEAALAMARQWLESEPKLEAVVLSPASASWGQFPNYEVRGDRFAALARGQ